MKNIFIKRIEYLYEPIFPLYTKSKYKVNIEVTFNFGEMQDCKILIGVNDTGEVSDRNIKRKILNHMNLLTERKYIDEI